MKKKELLPPEQQGEMPAAQPEAAAQTGQAPPAKAGGPALPTGTYPPANTPMPPAPPAPQPPPPPAKVRRVGTITMSLCLIAAGVLLVLWVFIPSIDYITIARLSPVILVFLGIEILVANTVYRGDKLKYDGLSIFICLLLIGASLVVAVVPQLVYNEIEGNRASRRLSVELEDRGYEALRAAGVEFDSLEFYVEAYGDGVDTEMTAQDIQPEQYVQFRIYFGNDYKDKNAFLADVAKVTKALQAIAPHIDYASFYSYGLSGEYDGNYTGDEHYELTLQNRHQFAEPVTRWADQVYTTYWAEDEGYYISEWEHEDRLQNPENYRLVEIEEEIQDISLPEVGTSLPEPVSEEEDSAAASAPTSLSIAA